MPQQRPDVSRPNNPNYPPSPYVDPLPVRGPVTKPVTPHPVKVPAKPAPPIKR